MSLFLTATEFSFKGILESLGRKFKRLWYKVDRVTDSGKKCACVSHKSNAILLYENKPTLTSPPRPTTPTPHPYPHLHPHQANSFILEYYPFQKVHNVLKSKQNYPNI